MLDSVKNKARELKQIHDQRVERSREILRQRDLQRKEQAIRQAKEEQAAIEAEKQQMQEEKERLLSLDNKGLMVEAILAIRGFYQRVSDIEESLESLNSKIQTLEAELAVMAATHSSDDED